MRFPSIRNVALVLARLNREIEASDEGCDVRLQVYPDGTWNVHWGPSDYDQDHRGFWGASGIPGGKRRFRSREIARDLINQAKDAYAESEES